MPLDERRRSRAGAARAAARRRAAGRRAAIAPASSARSAARASAHEPASSPSSPAGPSAAVRPSAGLARAGRARPGPLRVADHDAAGAAQLPRRARPAAAGAPAGPAPPRGRRARRPCAAASSPPRSAAASSSACAGGRVAQQQRDQLAPAALALALALRALLRVALDRVGRQLLDVGEDRLGERADHAAVEAGAPRRLREPPPGHARADPVGGLQRVERAALAQLAAAEPDVDVAAGLAAAVGVADQGDELAQRLGHADLHAAAERALERPRVLGHLAGIVARISVVTAPSSGSITSATSGGKRAPGLRF